MRIAIEAYLYNKLQRTDRLTITKFANFRINTIRRHYRYVYNCDSTLFFVPVTAKADDYAMLTNNVKHLDEQPLVIYL